MQEAVITGLGIVCPLGIGREAVWGSIENRQSGIREVWKLSDAGFPVTIGAEIPDFDPKHFVKPRKSLKVMCRETQVAFMAAELAWEDAGLVDTPVDPDRLGVVLGATVFRSELEELVALYADAGKDGTFDFGRWGSAMEQLYPLWMLKYLPNMSACHVGIAKDARGPNNSIVQGEVSSLLALIEAADYIARGQAEVMLAGATGSLLDWVDVCWHGDARLSHQNENPETACKPFDSRRDGMVLGEGAAVLVLESRTHAQQRGVKPLGRVLGYGRRTEPLAAGQASSGIAIRQAIEAALQMSRVSPQELGHVNAHGLGTVEEDAMEAQAIHSALGEVPVTAPKSYLGNPGAAGGAIELAVSLMGLAQGVIPPTLNYESADPQCPINVVTDFQPCRSPAMIKLSHKLTGQSVALMVSAE